MTLYQVSQGGTVNAADVNQFYNLLTGATTDQPVTVANRIRAQLTGATGGSGGYVGQTTGGPPGSGTFNVGDYIVDSLGTTWVCITAGSPGTWIPSGFATISEQTLGSNTATVTLSSIPATFKHLLLVIAGRSSGAVNTTDITAQVNGDTGANYSYMSWNTASSAATQVSASGAGGQTLMYVGAAYGASVSPSTAFGHTYALFPYYSAANMSRTMIALSGAVQGTTQVCTCRFGGWSNAAAAISSIALSLASGSFITNSFFGLYGMP